MKKDRIIQFVGFITLLESGSFIPKWKEYVRLLGPGHVNPELLEQEAEGKNRFRFISKHEWPDASFDFITKNGKRTEHFPELNVRAIHAGGYLLLHQDGNPAVAKNSPSLIVLAGHQETSADRFRKLGSVLSTSIYQAYYESCSHAYIAEIKAPLAVLEELMVVFRKQPGTEVCLCRAAGKLQPV